MCLELASTQELIEELYKRTSFVGVIIHSRSEQRNGAIHKDFNLYDRTGGNLEFVLNRITKLYKEHNG